MSAPLTASQLQLGEYTIGQLRSALQGLPSEDLCRFLKVMGCHTLRLALVQLCFFVLQARHLCLEPCQVWQTSDPARVTSCRGKLPPGGQ